MKKTKVIVPNAAASCAMVLTRNSATESSRARGARTTGLCARPEPGKRQNINNYREGKLDRLATFHSSQAHTCTAVTPRSWKTRSSL